MTASTNNATTTIDQEDRWTSADTLALTMTSSIVIVATAMALIPKIAHCSASVCTQFKHKAMVIGGSGLIFAAIYIFGLRNSALCHRPPQNSSAD